MNQEQLDQMAKDANADKVWKAGEVNDLPHTSEEVLQNLQHHGIDQNFLERDAYEKSVDFDDKRPTEPEEKLNY